MHPCQVERMISVPVRRLKVMYAALAVSLLTGPAVAALFEVLPWTRVSDRQMSDFGRSVLRGRAREWAHAESERFVYHARSAERLRAVAVEAEWLHAELGRRLDLPEPAVRGRIFIFDDMADWVRVMHAPRRREDGLAMQMGREIYVLRETSAGNAYLSLPHEMVHFRLWQAYGGGVPLWLEEGLAEYLAWELAYAYQETRGVQLYRERPPPPGEGFTWAELRDMQTYPTEYEQNRLFYRQAEQGARHLVEQLGSEAVGGFIRQVLVRDGDVEAVWEQDYGWDAEQMERARRAFQLIEE
jgi:hypothetical protein